jgi:cytochrome c peroxidase
MRPRVTLVRFAITLALAVTAVLAQEAYHWDLPPGFPPPLVPADNSMTASKIELGRYLFYDARLSVNGKTACATCHRPELAFTDGRTTALGTTGQIHTRNAMSLINAVYGASLTWGDATVRALEDQALVPMFGDRPVEMGLHEADGVPAGVAHDARYRDLFARAFPGESPALTYRNAVKAIAAFERTLIAAGSPYDRYHYGGDNSAVSAAARRGETIFFSQPFSCFRCHGGFLFSDSVEFDGHPRREPPVHTTGVASPGAFKAPSLRNVALTAPYMHDGSIATLEAVIDRYAAGGGHVPNQDPLIGGFTITPAQRADLIEFLRSLTGESLARNPKFANPW